MQAPSRTRCAPAEANAAPLTRTHGPVVLRLSDVTKRYRRHHVLRGVNLTLHGGEVAAVVGANGSGKSTLLNICAGVTRATSGNVERTARVGYAPQQHGVAPLLTAGEHFRLFGAVHSMGGRESEAIGTRLSQHLGWRPRPHAIAAHLSGGTRQKTSTSSSGELNRPDLILLDEPYGRLSIITRTWTLGPGVQVAGTQVPGRWSSTHLLHDLERVDHLVERPKVDES